MTRRFRRILSIRRTVALALALAVTAVGAPAAMADTPVGQDKLSVDTRNAGADFRVTGCPSNCAVVYQPDARHAGRTAPPIDRVSPDAPPSVGDHAPFRDAGRPAPAIDRVSPDARDNGRREKAPVVISAPAVAATDHFDWLDAGVGAAGLAVLLLLGGTAAAVRTRRGPIGAA